MIPIKVQCGCGQKYAFDVEPVQGRMPSTVACPVCGADGTGAANEIIARSMPAAAPAAPRPISLAVAATPPPMAAAPPPIAVAAPPPITPGQALSARLAEAARASTDATDATKWKWWYFVLAGVLFGCYSIWQAYDKHSIKPLGELFFAALCIAIGIWDFQYKRKKKKQQM